MNRAILAIGLALLLCRGASNAQTPPKSSPVMVAVGQQSQQLASRASAHNPQKSVMPAVTQGNSESQASNIDGSKKTAPPPAAEITAAAMEAQKAGKLVDDWHAQCEVRLEAIERLLAQFEQKQISATEAEVRTIEELKSLIPILKKCADELTVGFNEVSSDIDNYRRALLSAPNRFESLAALYNKQADSESDQFFVEQYKILAEQSLLVSGSMSARLQALDSAFEAAASRQHFIARSSVYLDHLATFLESIPASSTSQGVDDFLKAIDLYAEDLQRTIQSFRSFSKQISTKEDQPSTGRDGSLPHKRAPYLDSAAVLREPKQPIDSSY